MIRRDDEVSKDSDGRPPVQTVRPAVPEDERPFLMSCFGSAVRSPISTQKRSPVDLSPTRTDEISQVVGRGMGLSFDMQHSSIWPPGCVSVGRFVVQSGDLRKDPAGVRTGRRPGTGEPRSAWGRRADEWRKADGVTLPSTSRARLLSSQPGQSRRRRQASATGMRAASFCDRCSLHASVRARGRLLLPCSIMDGNLLNAATA